MTGPIAILGAGGFVGTRLVETLMLRGATNVRAVVRAFRSYAGLCRFGHGLSLVRADAEDVDALLPAITDCSAVVNLTTGSPASIVRSTETIYRACRQAKVPRLIHLSSAVVYGDVESPLIDDDAPPLQKHWMPYARAKAAAEIWLRERAGSLACQVVVLRPGIVWGARSPHTVSIAQALMEKKAYLVEDGAGIFNAIHVDNLVEAILTCLRHTADPSGFYNVADRETVTWHEFYTRLGAPLNCDVNQLAQVSGQHFPWSLHAAVEYVQSIALVNSLFHRFKGRIPSGMRVRLKRWLNGRPSYDEAAPTYARQPRVSRELWHLQRTRHKLPTDKFAREFGFTPPVTFEEGLRRTLQWLTFVGYIRSTVPITERQGQLV